MSAIPIVTVILTVFRRTEFLERAIQSVVSQTSTSWECIVTDDANTPAAREICSRFSKDSRIRYRGNQTTLGAPLNVAAALLEARGKYVTVFNDDDQLYPEMLNHLVAALEANPETVVAFGNHQIMNVDGLVMANESEAELRTHGRIGLDAGLVPNAFGFAVRCGLMVVMGSVFRRSAVDPAWLVREVGGAYDYWLSIKLAERGEFFYVTENVMSWRSHPNSVSSTDSPSVYAGEIFIYSTLAAGMLTPSLADYVKQRLAECLFARGFVYLQQGWNLSEARSVFYRSWRTKWCLASFCYWASTLIPAQARELSFLCGRGIRLVIFDKSN